MELSGDALTVNVTTETSVRIVVTDYEAISRCFTEDWQSHYYDLVDEDGVLAHFAFNCLHNGIEDASRLDGWADLDEGVVTMRSDRDMSFTVVDVLERWTTAP